MEPMLKGKTALVTGGSTGIGLGISEALAREGMNVVIASRTPDPAAKALVESYHVSCELISADVSSEAECIAMVETAVKKAGRLDAYVNNAAWTWHQSVTKITDEAWQSTINTNLRSCVFACREVSKHMIQAGGGGIVIIGSTVRFFPAFRESSYRISKMGLKMYMEELAIELAPHGIRVNMVTPGHFVTKMTAGISDEAVGKLREITPCGRSGHPIEVGNAVAFLLSDALSAFTCGADLVVDGGLTLHPLNPPCIDDIKALNL